MNNVWKKYENLHMREKRLKLYYLLWLIVGVAIILLGVLLTIKKPGFGVLIELIVGFVAFKISLQKIKMGLLIIGVAFLVEFFAYSFYCSTWSAVVCQRNLFVVSASSSILFGAIWIVSFLSLAVIKILKPKRI